MGLNRTGPARDAGYQFVHFLQKDINFGDTSEVIIGTLPKGAVIIKPASGVAINTVFNNGTTNTLHIGSKADNDLYGTALATGSLGFVPLDENVALKMTADTVITATQAISGTAATTGSATVIIAFTTPH